MLARLRDNPFFVLGIPTTASRLEVERAAQKLLAQLAIGASAAGTYESPLGPVERDESKVRQALAALRDPQERAVHALWAEDAPAFTPSSSPAPWSEALRSIGWRRP